MKNFKLILKSLINNDACIEGGRKRPWYFAVIIFILSILISIVPTFVTYIKVRGDDAFASQTYAMDTALYEFSNSLSDNGLSMIIQKTTEETKILVADVQSEAFGKVFSNNEVETPNYKYYVHSHNDQSAGKDIEDLRIYYIDKFATDAYDDIIAVTKYDAENKQYKVTYSTLVFSRDSVIFIVYNQSSAAIVATIPGDYESFEADYNLASTSANNGTIIENRDACFSNWKDVFTKMYNNTRVQQAWIWAGILAGINAILTFFMGLMVFILTRGKSNPFRIYTFWESTKISFWSALAPAILALVVGFISPNYAKLVFALMVSLRVMWMSMKSLKPDYNYQPQQSSNKKDDVKTVDVKSADKK